MTTASTLVAVPTRELPKEIGVRFREPEWLVHRRLNSLETYHNTELPDTVTHLWRYTDPSLFLLDSDEGVLAPVDAPAADPWLFAEREAPSGRAVLDKGRVVQVQLDESLQARKVILLDLHHAAHDYPSIVEHHLGGLISASHGKFEALNMALWQGGVFVHVPRNVRVEKPIHLVISGDDSVSFLAQRILVVAEEGVEMTLVAEFVSPKGATFHANSALELYGGRNSHLRCVCVQHWSEQVRWFFTQRAKLERDAQYRNVWAGLGGRITKTDIGSILNGRGTNARMYGITFAHKRQHFDQHTVHWHSSSQSTSNLNVKVVLKDKARSAYTGLIRIEENAADCEAYQENRNLLVSDGPRVDTIPELEILNDEVQCTHGATIGPIDPMQLFYLQARGIRHEEAVRLIVAGFVETTVNEMPAELQERLHALVGERLRDI